MADHEALSYSQADAMNFVARSAAGMTAASMIGFSLMTQAAGMWMGAVLRSMDGAEAPVDAPVARKAEAPVRRAKAAKVSADDLKMIGGIGPKLEKVLNDLGITTYAQVAALGPGEIAGIEEKLGFAGRIGRDGWVDQASKLAAGN